MRTTLSNLLEVILTELCSAPDSQLSEQLREKAKLVLHSPKADVAAYETKILEYFAEVEKAPRTEVSSFVAKLVDTKYTSTYRTKPC